VSAAIVIDHLAAAPTATARTTAFSQVTKGSGTSNVVYYRAAREEANRTIRNRPAWRKFAATAPQTAGRPMIAIIIDDMGPDQKNARRAMTMAAPVTLSFLPYADNLTPLVARARANGHEVLLHLPMEPDNSRFHRPGPNSLKTGLSKAELDRRLAWNLGRFKGYVGINNHMGSRFTADAQALRPVIDELRRRGLLFLDSRTTTQSAGRRLALQAGVPYGARDIFLDNERSAKRVAGQLRLVEKIARRNGAVIAIGHPHDETLSALEQWIGDLKQRGFVLAPVSAVIARGYRVADADGLSNSRYE